MSVSMKQMKWDQVVGGCCMKISQHPGYNGTVESCKVRLMTETLDKQTPSVKQVCPLDLSHITIKKKSLCFRKKSSSLVNKRTKFGLLYEKLQLFPTYCCVDCLMNSVSAKYYIKTDLKRGFDCKLKEIFKESSNIRRTTNLFKACSHVTLFFC